jgi:hypothetical protein
MIHKSYGRLFGNRRRMYPRTRDRPSSVAILRELRGLRNNMRSVRKAIKNVKNQLRKKKPLDQPELGFKSEQSPLPPPRLTFPPKTSHQPCSSATQNAPTPTVPQSNVTGIKIVHSPVSTYPIKPTAPASFFSLPPEVRVKIFGEVFQESTPIDLAPMSSIPNQKGKLRMRNYHHLNEVVLPFLRSLWLSPALAQESTEAFFRYSDFRFTGRSGWHEATQFLQHVPRGHLQHITRFTISLPIGDGLMIDEYDQPKGLNRELDDKLHYADYKLGQPFQFDYNHPFSFHDPTPWLCKATSLQTLNLVLQPGLYIPSADLPADIIRSVLNQPESMAAGFAKYEGLEWANLLRLQAARPDLKFILVKLFKQPAYDDIPRLKEERMSRGYTQTLYKNDVLNHFPLMKRCEQLGWLSTTHYYSVRGEWPVGAYEYVGDEDGSAEWVAKMTAPPKQLEMPGSESDTEEDDDNDEEDDEEDDGEYGSLFEE